MSAAGRKRPPRRTADVRKGESMNFNRLTWAGLLIVALGWSLLLSAPRLAQIVILPGPTPHFDLIAQFTILSGFGIAVLGAVQTGFGVLNKFIEGALAKPAQSEAQSGAKAIAIAQPSSRSRKILERGWVKNRAFILFTDGTVEVETMLGRRQFPSLQDAQEFIA